MTSEDGRLGDWLSDHEKSGNTGTELVRFQYPYLLIMDLALLPLTVGIVSGAAVNVGDSGCSRSPLTASRSCKMQNGGGVGM